MKRLICFLALICNTAVADPLAILGGQGPAPYAALLQHDGSLLHLDLPLSGLTFRVAMNPSGYGIVGGTSGVNAYAALVSPQGVLAQASGLIAPGEIYTVAINKAGNGIVGGGYAVGSIPYAALISKEGTATSLSVPVSGLIYGVAIDNSGEGVLGGIGPLSSAYASLVSPSGTVTSISGLPTTGAIYWVSSNDSKTRFIGGSDGANIYAAFLDPNNILRPVVGLPAGINYSVGVNASGNAIMGGVASNQPYAALVTNNGSVTTLNGLPTTAGKIYNVQINESGAGLLTGYSTTGPYGSLVAPDGTLTPLKGLPVGNGFLDGAALHNAGVGIVGGSISNVPFAALVAPNGHLTYLSGLPAAGEINSVSLAVLDNLVPQSIGPFDSFANTQFAFSDALTQHLIDINHSCDDSASMWLSAFGNCVQEHAFSNKIYGVVLGLDYRDIQDVVIGGGVAYAYNAVHYCHGYGKASINQESAVVYAAWNNECIYMNAALWGGAFQTTNKRRSLSLITSTAKPYGWNLAPHFEVSVPFSQLEAFMAFDYANNWQTHFRERGSSGFNIKLNNQYAAIFRSEIGFRFFETFSWDWCHLVLEEKISYVNRTPTHKGKGAAAFIGSISSFGVETMDSSSKNLCTIQLHAECTPSNLNNMQASFDYQGGFGSSFESHMLTLNLIKNF